MAAKYLPIRNATEYRFGGGANDIRVSDPADTTNYYVDSGGGADSIFLVGGNDTVYAGKGSDLVHGGLGDDTIYGGTGSDDVARKAEYDELFGEGYSLAVAGGDDTVYAAGGSSNSHTTLYGDAYIFYDGAVGGSDRLYGGTYALNALYGDAYTIGAGASGGADYLEGGDHAYPNYLYGDAYTLEGTEGNLAEGGVDELVGGSGADAVNALYGDARDLLAWSWASDDTLRGGDSGAANFIAGDAEYIKSNAHAGDDILFGGDSSANSLYGDAFVGQGSATCGNDVLHAGNNAGLTSVLAGDVQNAMSSLLVFGNDALWAGAGNDTLWGDAQFIDGGNTIVGGADDFVFNGGIFGQDRIGDFETGKDKIYILTDLAASDFSVQVEGDDTFIGVIGDLYGNRIQIVGVTSLQPGDLVVEAAGAYSG